MKDLNKNEVYDLRGITEEQAKEVYEWLLKNEPQWNANGFSEINDRTGIHHDGYRFIFTIPNSETTHISTLFEEKSLEEQLQDALKLADELKKQIEERDKPKIGDVCKFWDDIENEYHISILKEIDDDDDLRFLSTCNWNVHAKKLTQKEVIDLLFGN